MQNYVDAWGSNNFARYFLNSTLVAVATTVLTVLLASMMAYGFARFDFPGRRILFAVVVVGLTVPTMLLIIPQFLLARDLHLLDSLHGLVPFYVGTQLAFSTFLLRAFFERLPLELDEAMAIDGAGPWRRFWSLALPLSRPALATCAIFTFLGSWDEFVWALDRDQRRGQPHAADRHRPVPRPAQHELGADLRRLGDRHRAGDRRLRDRPTPHRVRPHQRSDQELMTPLELLPTRAAYRTGGRDRGRGPRPATRAAAVTVFHLGDAVATRSAVGR